MHGELIHAEAAEQAGILLENADDFVQAAVEADHLADGVDVRKQGVGDGLANDDHVARVLQIELGDEAALGHRKERHGVGILRFDSAHDHALDVLIAVADFVRRLRPG